MTKNIPQATTAFFYRLLAFVIFFIVVTGITGSYVVGSRLLYGFYFFVYGNVGKLILFSCGAIFLFFRNKNIIIVPIQNSWKHIFYSSIAFLLIPLFFLLAKKLLVYQSFMANIPLSLTVHIVLVSIPFFFALGIFTPSFLWTVVKRYWQQIFLGVGCGIVYDISIFYLWQLWPLFSNVVLVAVTWVFGLTEKVVYIIPPRTLFVHNFAITIGEACSGIDSLYLLLTLYALIIGIDWKVLEKRKVILFFIPLFVGMFGINIVRVYVLIYLGIIFTPHITMQLFHTYLGLVLFLLYFGVFLYFVYPKMKLKKEKLL